MNTNNGVLINTIVDKFNSSQSTILDKLIKLDNSFNQINNETMRQLSNNDVAIVIK